MVSKSLLLFALLAGLSCAVAIDISDLVWWGADVLTGTSGEQRNGVNGQGGDTATAAADVAPGTGTEPRRTCHCSGPACMCCLDFNMTYIDLGGPGCVRLRYMGMQHGIAMNVSYGDSLLHSEVVKATSPSGTCIDILSSLAQVCARFRSLTPIEENKGDGESDAARGCLQLEPTLLGEVQTIYPVGCFRMSPKLMTLEPLENSTSDFSNPVSTEAPSTSTDLNAESLIAAVSETAEQGIDLLTNWLGLTLEEDNNSTSTAAESTSTSAPEDQSSSSRAFLL